VLKPVDPVKAPSSPVLSKGRNLCNSWECNDKGEQPSLQPVMNIANQPDVKNTKDQRHYAGHQRRHEECEYNFLILTVDHLKALKLIKRTVYCQ
jgi:hypothetical protein